MLVDVLNREKTREREIWRCFYGQRGENWIVAGDKNDTEEIAKVVADGKPARPGDKNSKFLEPP